jgi:hypothetical protein
MDIRFSERVTSFLIVAVIAVSGLLGLGLLTSGHDWGDDFASYIMQAESIVSGRPLDFINANTFTISKSSENLGPVAYPWGTPVLLAPIAALFGLNVTALKIVNWIFYMLFLIAIAGGLRNRLSPLSLIAMTALLGLDPAILDLFNGILSDIPFLFFSTVTVLLIGRVVVERQTILRHGLGEVLLGILLAVCGFIRSAGFLLAAVAILSEIVSSAALFRRDSRPESSMGGKTDKAHSGMGGIPWKPLFFRALPYLVFLGLTGVGYLLFPGGEDGYLQSLGAISVGQIKTNVIYYMDRWQWFFSAIPYFPLVFGAILPFFLTGLIKTIGKYYPMAIFSTLMMGLIIVWPATQGLRFLLPLFPFFLLFFFLGLEELVRTQKGMEGKVIRAAAVACLLLAAFFFFRQSAERVLANVRNAREVSDGPFSAGSQEMFTYIRGNTAEESVILFFKPRAMRLVTGRPSLQINTPSDIPIGNYLCIYEDEDEGFQITDAEIQKLVEEGRIMLAFQNADFRVYEILP